MNNIIRMATTWANTFRKSDSEAGQTALEYALVVALVSIVLVAALVGFGNELLQDAFDEVGEFAGGGS